MAEPERRLPSPPYNPGLRGLVEGKRAWDARANLSNLRAGFRGWHERGYIPHRDSPGLTQFITWHLADAYPASLRGEWAALLRIEEDRERRKKLEAYLDKGRGDCCLRRPELATVCQRALQEFDGRSYVLKAWCIMPNHVHVLVLTTAVPMSEFVRAWKGATARQSNQLLGRVKSSFWAEGYWDTYMRDERQEQKAARYIESNPVKAGLAKETRQWPWSSASGKA
ncbi:MAG TPA: transposase [Verrucomicrobiae bacterium]